MSYSSPYSSFSHRYPPILCLIAFGVLLLHVGLLGIGTWWNFSPPPPPLRSKVIVQTIHLKSVENPSSVSLTTPLVTDLFSSLAPPVKESSPSLPTLVKESASVKESSPIPSDSLLQQEEIPLLKQKEAESVISYPDSTLSPIKVENTSSKTENASFSQGSTPKPSVIETKKTPPKKPAPIKKPTESAKKNKIETVKAVNETNKKRQQEQINAEKKRQTAQEEAEKKRQQEQVEKEKKRQTAQAETEKKRQQERIEAEKKLQQEIAIAQEAAKQREQVLLAKAKENLAKMGETRDKISSSSVISLDTTPLKEVGNLQVDALPVGEIGNEGEWGTKEMSYSEEVAYRLKMALKLPDYGAVKIKLTLSRTGKVIKVETLHSESSKNKAYVENKILSLLFPSFGQRFQGVSQNTFVITLQNDS